MPADASIFQNFLRAPKSVQDYDNEAMQAQSNALAMKTQQAQYNALAQQQQDDQALRNYLAGGAKLDTPEGQAGLYRVAPKAAGSILKSQAEIAKENAAAGKDKALAAKASQELIGESIKNSRVNLEGVTTPEQYIAWHEANHKDPVLGPYLESRGVTVDQARARINQAMQTPDGFIQLINESKLGAEKAYANAMQEKTLAETVRHNTTSEGLTKRGQDVAAATAAAARRQADEHFKTAQASGGKAVAATEDERKAAGWLSQADNAWKNMQAAMGGVDPKTGEFKDASVARPGVADAIASIPSFGLGEVVGNSLRSPERQKFNQAASSLSEAILRAATGAGVNKDEALQKIRELTPVFGEDPATTKQKMDSIPMYLSALKQRAGRAIPQVSSSGNGGGVVDFGSLK